MAERILVIDDDVEFVELVSEYLRREGFEVEAIHNGEVGLTHALAGEHSLIILDVMLPGIGGFEVLRRIRGAHSPAFRIPILVLTARGDEIDRIMGLEWGADDYLSKPHSPQELLARVRAMLRRVQFDRDSPQIPASVTNQRSRPGRVSMSVGDTELNSNTRTAMVAGTPLDLTAVEFELLALLMIYAGQVVTREMVSREVFDRPLTHLDRTLDVHISNLRRKLGVPANGAERIRTIRGVGYILTID